MSDTIICPNCKTEIEVTEVLSAQLRDELQKKFDGELSRRLQAERDKLAQDALKKAKADLAVELNDMETELAESKTKLLASQEAELELRKNKRQLEDAKRELEVTVARRMDEETAKIRVAAKKEADDERRLKDAEKDKLVSDLRLQIDVLQRKSEQGSQQLQGEVLEIELEELLRRAFPFDTILPVPKGVHGGDVIQIVHDTGGTECGIILWESKRTKSWSDGWLPKLRDDQREAKAHIAILVSIELPKGCTTFDSLEGVWVTNRACVLGLATALRAGLIEVATARRSVDGKQSKMDMLYSYLSGPEFRHRVEGIAESFIALKEDLESEKRAMQRIWAKREKQLDRAITSTTGLHGDLSGIIGRNLLSIDCLELPAITDGTALDENGEGDTP